MSLLSENTIEWVRMAVVYAHLIACCVAVGLVFMSDVAMGRALLRGGRAALIDVRQLRCVGGAVTSALVVLWLSGGALVAIDVAVKGLAYLENPKLQSKLLVVVVLTVNGLVLHRRVIPWLMKAGSMFKLPGTRCLATILCGAVSGVSWLYAAMLGVSRPLSWKFSVVELLMPYPLLVVGVFFFMLGLMFRRRIGKEGPAFEPTAIFARPSRLG